MANHLWGIDLGGTKIECVEADEGYHHVLDQIEKLVNQISEKLDSRPTRIGIGTPGSINPHSDKLRNCNSVYLNGHKFQLDLQEKLNLPIAISNDANCFALSEYKMGVIKESFPDVQNVFGIIMGTGVGSGLIINGSLVEGKNGIGGEWGHNFLDASGGC